MSTTNWKRGEHLELSLENKLDDLYNESEANTSDIADLKKIASIKSYTDTEKRNITIGNSGYMELEKPEAIIGKQIVSIVVTSWSANTGAFTLIPMYDASDKFYVAGKAADTITGATFRFYYIE